MQDDESRRNRTDFIVNDMKDWLETKFKNGIPAANYGATAYAAMKTRNCSICKKNLYSLWKKEKFDTMNEAHKSLYLQDGIEKLGPVHMEYAKRMAEITDPTNNSFKSLHLFAFNGRPMNNVKANASTASGGRKKRRRSRRKSRRGNKSRKSRRKRRKSRKKRKRRTRRRRRR